MAVKVGDLRPSILRQTQRQLFYMNHAVKEKHEMEDAKKWFLNRHMEIELTSAGYEVFYKGSCILDAYGKCRDYYRFSMLNIAARREGLT